MNRLIIIEFQNKPNSVTKGLKLLLNMDHKHGLYFRPHTCPMKKYLNLRLTKIKIFHTHICRNNRFLARQTGSLKCVFCMLYDPFLYTYSFVVFKLLLTQFLFYSIQNIKGFILSCLSLVLLLSFKYLNFANKEYLNFRNFGWLTKIIHIDNQGVYSYS